MLLLRFTKSNFPCPVFILKINKIKVSRKIHIHTPPHLYRKSHLNTHDSHSLDTFFTCRCYCTMWIILALMSWSRELYMVYHWVQRRHFIQTGMWQFSANKIRNQSQEESVWKRTNNDHGWILFLLVSKVRTQSLTLSLTFLMSLFYTISGFSWSHLICYAIIIWLLFSFQSHDRNPAWQAEVCLFTPFQETATCPGVPPR